MASGNLLHLHEVPETDLFSLQRRCFDACSRTSRSLASPSSFRSGLQLLVRIGPAIYLIYLTRDLGSVGSALTAVLCAILWTSATAAVFHDAAHRTASRVPVVNRLFASIASAPLGLSLEWWRIEHVRLHHNHVGSALDPDAQFSVLGRVTAMSPWRRWFRYQHCYLPLLYPLLLLEMIIPMDLWHMRFGRAGGSIRFAPMRGSSFRRAVAWKYGPFTIFWLSMAMYLAGWSFYVFALVFVSTSGLLIAIIVHVQHNNALIRQRSGPTPNLQLGLTTDTCTNGRVWSFIAGNTNHHLAHHLFPSVPSHRLPALTKVLRNAIEREGFAYPCFTSIPSALCSHYSLLRALGQNPAPRVDLTI